MYKGDRIRRRGEVSRALVVTGGCGTTAESNAKIHFGGSMLVKATVIWKVWWGQGRRVIVSLWK